MTPRLRSLLGAATVFAVTLACSACTQASTTPQTSQTTTPAASTSSPAPLTCRSILAARTVHDLTAAGWSSRKDVFVVGEQKLPGGIECIWGDARVASDNVQVYGWAPITAAQAQAAQEELLTAGWRQLGSGNDVYITEPASQVIDADADGFGQTYRFTPGFVTVSDTKQGLLLVHAPA